MAFAIKRRNPLPPFNGTDFRPFFYPTFFLLQLNLYLNLMKRILHLVIILKSSYNWFKYQISILFWNTSLDGPPRSLF